jgi:hypothetical protein
VILEMQDGEAVEIGRLDGANGLVNPTLDNGRAGTVVITVPEYSDSDPRCCPSRQARQVWEYQDGSFIKVSETSEPS